MTVTGVALIGLGVLLLTVEVPLFRATTQSKDFTGLTCGTPIDHPRWKTGHPCHGAVNRQTAVTGFVLLAGLGLGVVSAILLVQRRMTERSDSTPESPSGGHDD
jgi:hypothetical protein